MLNILKKIFKNKKKISSIKTSKPVNQRVFSNYCKRKIDSLKKWELVKVCPICEIDFIKEYKTSITCKNCKTKFIVRNNKETKVSNLYVKEEYELFDFSSISVIEWVNKTFEDFSDVINDYLDNVDDIISIKDAMWGLHNAIFDEAHIRRDFNTATMIRRSMKNISYNEERVLDGINLAVEEIVYCYIAHNGIVSERDITNIFEKALEIELSSSELENKIFEKGNDLLSKENSKKMLKEIKSLSIF